MLMGRQAADGIASRACEIGCERTEGSIEGIEMEDRTAMFEMEECIEKVEDENKMFEMWLNRTVFADLADCKCNHSDPNGLDEPNFAVQVD